MRNIVGESGFVDKISFIYFIENIFGSVTQVIVKLIAWKFMKASTLHILGVFTISI